jgi:hypothetical protein
MTGQPGASNGVYGFEYCALIYYSHAGSGFFLSALSDIRNRLDSNVKTCLRPARLNDQSHPDAVTVGDAHNHPHNRRFSPQDLSAAARWYPDRIVDKHSGQDWHRNLMLFYREKTGECRAYTYDNASRVVSALRDGHWVPIGEVQDDIGNIKMHDGMDWLP